MSAGWICIVKFNDQVVNELVCCAKIETLKKEPEARSLRNWWHHMWRHAHVIILN